MKKKKVELSFVIMTFSRRSMYWPALAQNTIIKSNDDCFLWHDFYWMKIRQWIWWLTINVYAATCVSTRQSVNSTHRTSPIHCRFITIRRWCLENGFFSYSGCIQLYKCLLALSSYEKFHMIRMRKMVEQ